jgi:phosphoserine phosphatase
VCGRLKAEHNYTNMVIIGDGSTDMEACPPADAFIGFGGNVVRDAVCYNMRISDVIFISI